jgi:hypothetical protein
VIHSFPYLQKKTAQVRLGGLEFPKNLLSYLPKHKLALNKNENQNNNANKKGEIYFDHLISLCLNHYTR